MWMWRVCVCVGRRGEYASCVRLQLVVWNTCVPHAQLSWSLPTTQTTGRDFHTAVCPWHYLRGVVHKKLSSFIPFMLFFVEHKRRFFQKCVKYCSVINIFLNIFFCVVREKETHTCLKRRVNKWWKYFHLWVNYTFNSRHDSTALMKSQTFTLYKKLPSEFLKCAALTEKPHVQKHIWFYNSFVWMTCQLLCETHVC